MTSNTPNEPQKLDPYDQSVQTPTLPADTEKKRASSLELKNVSRRVIMIVIALVSLFAMGSILSRRASLKGQQAEDYRQEQSEKDSALVTIQDTKSAKQDASKKLNAVKQAKINAARTARNTPDGKTASTPSTGPGPVAVNDPLPDPGPVREDLDKDDAQDPWAQARTQYRASKAQEYYQHMSAARSAPIFFAGGSPSGTSDSKGSAPGSSRPDSAESFRQSAAQARQERLRVQTASPSTNRLRASSRGSAQDHDIAGRQAFFNGSRHTDVGTTGASSGTSFVEVGTVIHAVLETGIDSSLPGHMFARVAQPVWDAQISRILIPSGTRLVGLYNARTSTGQERIQAVWTTLILPSGQTIRLESLEGAGLDGRSGFDARVDEHWDQLLAGAALAGVFSASAAVIAGPTNALSVNPAQQAAYGAAAPLQSAGEGLTERALKIEPTLHVAPGARIGVLVSKRLWL